MNSKENLIQLQKTNNVPIEINDIITLFLESYKGKCVWGGIRRNRATIG